MYRKYLIYLAIIVNITALVLGIIFYTKPFYKISLKGTIDNVFYDTSVEFGLNTYSCSYLDKVSSIKKIYTVEYETFATYCYPVLPPHSDLTYVAIKYFFVKLLIVISYIVTFIGLFLQILVVFYKPIQRQSLGQLSVVVSGVVSVILILVSLVLTIVNKSLVYYPRDIDPNSYDKSSERICSKFWCNSYKGEGSEDTTTQNFTAEWGQMKAFSFAIVYGILVLVASIITLISRPINFKNRTPLLNKESI